MASKKQQLSSNNLLIVMLLISLLVVGVSGLAAKALFGSIARDTKVVQKKLAADSQLKKNEIAAPDLVSDFGALGVKNRLLSDALPVTVDFPSLIVSLENMSNISGMKLKSITPSLATAGVFNAASKPVAEDPTMAPEPQKYQFSINVSGSYDSLLKLFTALEKSARPMRVVAVQVAGTGSSMASEIEVETYYQAKAQLPFGKETVK